MYTKYLPPSMSPPDNNTLHHQSKSPSPTALDETERVGQPRTSRRHAARMDRVGKWTLWPDQNPVPKMVWIQSIFPVGQRQLHIFCDASERAHGSVAYLRIENEQGGTHVSFVMARSRVAPKNQLTIPWNVEILLTRGKRLTELTEQSRWSRGPGFLSMSSDQWPVHIPNIQGPVPDLRKPLFCGLTQIQRHPDLPDPSQFSTWQDLIEATHQHLQETAPTGTLPFTQAEVETHILSKAQSESFPEDFHVLKSNKELPTNSHLSSLAPQYEHKLNLVRVGRRLRLAEELEPRAMSPTVLNPRHPVTPLIIKDYDTRLLHTGPGRIYAEIRRSYWILKGQQAVKKHQWEVPVMRLS